MMKLLDNSLLTYPQLKDFNVSLYVTYDNTIWGNLSPLLAKSEEEKKHIKEKDQKLLNITKAQRLFVSTTPVEPTIVILNNDTAKTLEYKNDSQTIYIRTNGIIAHLLDYRYEIVFATADAPVFIVVLPNFEGVITIHLGFSQVYAGLHNLVFKLFKTLYPTLDLSTAKVFITPYICKDHYYINQEKYQHFFGDFRVQKKRFANHVTLKNDKYYIDFVGLAKFELKQHFGINTFYEPGICTYEEARKDKLFSYKYSKEHNIPPGVFNVRVVVG